MAGVFQQNAAEKGEDEQLDPSVLLRLSTLKERFGKLQLKSKEWKFYGKWLRSGVIHFSDPNGKEMIHETVERTTRLNPNDVDAVDLITILPASKKPEKESVNGTGTQKKRICLVINYRPSVDRFCVEFPSGLVDPEDPSLHHAAERELAEETGYHGDIQFFSSVIHCDPWKSNENSILGIAKVTCPEDKGEQSLDEDEYLETIELPLKNLRNQLDVLHKHYNLYIDAKLYSFAVGLEFQAKLLI